MVGTEADHRQGCCADRWTVGQILVLGETPATAIEMPQYEGIR